MSRSCDVVVVGAGLVGLAAARALAAAGRRVALHERGEPGAEASSAAAGMLAPQIEADPGEPGLRTGVAARERYAELAAALRRDTGVDVRLRGCGIALAAFDERRAEELRRAAREQRAAGLEAEWLDRAALATRHPGVGPGVVGAFLASRDGSVDNPALVRAMLRDAVRRGVELRPHDEVREIVTRGGRVAGVRAARGSLDATAVVVAAGAWAGRLAGLPRPLPVEPMRGQMLAVRWPPGEPPGILFGRGAYVVERDGEAILGSTMERGGFEKDVTPAGLRHILAEACALLPSLGDQPVHRTWAGLRPMTPDGAPIIGPDPECPGLIYATGHGRGGILLGPLTGEIVRDLLVDGETPWDLAPYSVLRFGDATGAARTGA